MLVWRFFSQKKKKIIISDQNGQTDNIHGIVPRLVGWGVGGVLGLSPFSVFLTLYPGTEALAEGNQRCHYLLARLCVDTEMSGQLSKPFSSSPQTRLSLGFCICKTLSYMNQQVGPNVCCARDIDISVNTRAL